MHSKHVWELFYTPGHWTIPFSVFFFFPVPSALPSLLLLLAQKLQLTKLFLEMAQQLQCWQHVAIHISQQRAWIRFFKTLQGPHRLSRKQESDTNQGQVASTRVPVRDGINRPLTGRQSLPVGGCIGMGFSVNLDCIPWCRKIDRKCKNRQTLPFF